MTSPYQALPSVSSVIATIRAAGASSFADEALVPLIQTWLDDERRAITTCDRPSRATVEERLLGRLRDVEQPRLEAIVNATGVVIHTNLGRAPVSRETREAISEAAGNAVSLEIEPESNQRGGRLREIATLMRALTGAEASIVVNNNAAAVLLTLAALCAGRSVIVSRGEAVEIGGGFRIPDVLRQSGATLVEVGTTNRTYVRDYEAAIDDRTAAILKVHPSNFRISGFTASTTIAELAPLASRSGIALIDDLGSGALIDTHAFGLMPEPTIKASLADGASIVTASGDKLIGGPQAGVIAGRADLIATIEAHPLARAVRADKTCLAGLAATLRHYARGEATTTVPIWRMIAATSTELLLRAERLAGSLATRSASVAVAATQSTVGGGSLPGEVLPSYALALSVPTGAELEELARRLRTGAPRVFGRIEDDRLLLDLRTVLPEDDQRFAAAVAAALSESPLM